MSKFAFRTHAEASRFAKTVRGRRRVQEGTLELACGADQELTAKVTKARGRTKQAVRAAGYNYAVAVSCRRR
jgi:hypothetical protein